ncbi:MAG: EAL domain-containing protein [Steroidobacteraceae bacterium]|nr:EAL domain-containing protein [Steroidobacteraceae bacterium]
MNGTQPPAARLRAAVAQWFDQPSGWYVLLAAGLAAAAMLAGQVPGATRYGFSPVLATASTTLAAIAAAWWAGRLEGVSAPRRLAWRWLGVALLVQIVGTLAIATLESPGAWPLHSWAAAPKFLFFPCAAAAATAMLLSTRRQPFGAPFWLEALLVALCIGAVLWLALPRDLTPFPMPTAMPSVLAAWAVTLDAAVLVLAAALLLRRSDWRGWPGVVLFALGLVMLSGSRLMEAITVAGHGTPAPVCPPYLLALVAFALAAHFEYLRTVRQAPPMDAAERGSPLAALLPYAALMLAGITLLSLHTGSRDEPAHVIAWVVCIAAGLLFARQALSAARAIAVQTGLARRSAEARFAALIRNTADVIAVVDAQGSFSYLTPTAERIFGQPPQELIGRKLAALVALEDRARLREFFARDLALPGAAAHVEARIPRGDEKHRIVEIHASNMLQEPAIGGFLLNLRDHTDRKGMEEQLKRLALHDPLTLLANRSLFRDRLEHAVAVARRNGRGVAVLFVDLDNFKQVNDSHGHATGDRVLHRSAQRLVKATRNGDTVARFGGDEFAVLLENLTGKDQVIEIAARIVEALQGPLELTGNDTRVGASVGVAFAGPDDSVEELLRNADVAMYASKARGKGCYTVHEPAMNRAASERQEMEAEIARGLEQRQFLIHYLPTVDLRSGYLLGVEALLRWQHPARGLIGPMEFLPVAERSGQIVTLGRWVLAQACREVRVWQARLPEGRQVRVSVNVSAVQLAQSDICADVENALRISSLDAGNLAIELKESVLMQNGEDALATLNQLRKLGVRIAIDDFGTGLSSLSYLHRFPIDILKIDRSFVEQLDRIEDGAGLARAIITLGETLGLEVVAEGIESEQQQSRLVELGCVAGQGYYYSRPAMLHDLEDSVHMLRRRTMADTLPQGTRFTATGRFVVGDLHPMDLSFASTGTSGPRRIEKE